MGRLLWTNNRGRLHLNCNSMGALFVEANSNSTLADLEDFFPTPEMRKLVPSPDYHTPIEQLPLLLVQFTAFRCGGFCLGLGVSHVMVDGQAAAHFLSEWARIARGEKPKNLPFHDRTILVPGDGGALPPGFYLPEFEPPPLLIGHSDSSEERRKETTLTFLKLSRDQIDKLKNMASEVRTLHNTRRAFTRYEVVAGHIWRCLCMARNHRDDQPTRMRFGVDIRRRIEPPLPEWYFGNALLPVVVTATSGELEEPLAYTCGRIREAVEKFTDKYIRAYLSFLSREDDLSKFRFSHEVASAQGTFLGNPNANITSWLNIPVYGTDFGWGKEIHLGPGGLGFDGKAYIMPGKDEQGSLVIPLRLQIVHMDAFKKLFYQGLQNRQVHGRRKSNL